ncbi:hypothetical protein SLEP1_g19825 [Rubroshorea leprosula]|uniref:Uncharacterized protein n=1 Tax=Rubroshorea leprosula TaxID=152421 RepID=A0AAV5J642_9ROSI|nr:hypothetical protein SLEP1_g19825 [Rubroshorea leprosula]
MHFYGSSSLQPVLPPLQRHKESWLDNLCLVTVYKFAK